MSTLERENRMVALFFSPGPRVVQAARTWLREEQAARGSLPGVAGEVSQWSDAQVLDAIHSLYHPWPATVAGLDRFLRDFYAAESSLREVEPTVDRGVLVLQDEFSAVNMPAIDSKLAGVMQRLRKAGLPQLIPASALVNGARR